MKSPIWTITPRQIPGSAFAGCLADEPDFCTLLVQRGITTREAARSFFKPKWEDHDPFLMMDMDRAVERLDRALQQGERILLYGDYQ